MPLGGAVAGADPYVVVPGVAFRGELKLRFPSRREDEDIATVLIREVFCYFARTAPDHGLRAENGLTAFVRNDAINGRLAGSQRWGVTGASGDNLLNVLLRGDHTSGQHCYGYH
jgi:hypothetical protein